MRRLSPIRRFLWSAHGQSLVETALALPLMAFTLLGGADMARAFAIQLAVQNGARAAAEAAALDVYRTSTDIAEHAQQEMDRTPGMSVSGTCTASGTTLTCGGSTISVTFTQANKTSACSGAASTAVAGTSSIATPCYANINVRYTFSTLVAWPGLPHSFTFNRDTFFRRYQ